MRMEYDTYEGVDQKVTTQVMKQEHYWIFIQCGSKVKTLCHGIFKMYIDY